MARRGASTRTRRAKPSRIRAPPITPSMPTPGPDPVKARDFEAAVTTLEPPPLVVGVEPGLVVGVGGAVVLVDPPPATAMIGARGLPVGAVIATPEGVTELLA